MESMFRELLPDSVDGLAPILSGAIMAAVFLGVGLWAAGAVAGWIRKRVATSDRLDPTLGNFFASIAKYLILAVVIIAVLQLFGFQATSLVAVLGAATLAIGLALQGTLGNVAAGVMLIMFRPYKLGDYVQVAGHSGTVKDLNIFTTELVTPDGVRIVIPNGECWGGSVVNYAVERRRVDLTFGISYDDDIEKAIGVILGVIEADSRFLNEPAEPWVRVVNLGDSSVDLQMRAWTSASDYWEARFAALRAVKEAFDRAGVEIPYPHQVEIARSEAPRS